MRYFIWALSLTLLIFAASCNVLDPAANQVTVEASNVSGICCPVVVNLDGNNTVTIGSGSNYTFPTTGSGSHTLNFSTYNGASGCSGSCVYANSGSSSYSKTFNTSGGNLYVGAVTQSTGFALKESGP
jgi:hypothetical protein